MRYFNREGKWDTYRLNITIWSSISQHDWIKVRISLNSNMLFLLTLWSFLTFSWGGILARESSLGSSVSGWVCPRSSARPAVELGTYRGMTMRVDVWCLAGDRMSRLLGNRPERCPFVWPLGCGCMRIPPQVHRASQFCPPIHDRWWIPCISVWIENQSLILHLAFIQNQHRGTLKLQLSYSHDQRLWTLP